MIVLTNTTDQTISEGESLVFDTVVHKSGCGERHRPNTGSVKLAANGIYEIHFNGNMTGATAGTAVELTIELGGEKLTETEMVYTPSTADAIGEVSATTAVRNCCGDYDIVTIVNTGSEDVTVSSGCCLFVKRLA